MLDVDRYLDRIGWRGEITLDRGGLEALQRAHLSTVPFENLHVAARVGVRTDLEWSWNKVVVERRGGWCFELNGLFAELLTALGFETRRLGAAVQLNGPNDVVDHCTIEVTLTHPDDGRPWPHLVDVGFGESFLRPLALNDPDPQDGGIGEFQFIPSPRGTTLARIVDEVPEAQFRFKRVTVEMTDFDAASRWLQSDDDLHWRHKPFATRLLDGGPDRVTLLSDRLKVQRGGSTTESSVPAEDWDEVLRSWFGLSDVRRAPSHGSGPGS